MYTTDSSTTDTWLLKLNVQKCKVMSYGRHADRNYTYTMVMNGQSAALDYEDHIKDLGITFDEKLDFSVHIAEKNNKAYRMLWLIVSE